MSKPIAPKNASLNKKLESSLDTIKSVLVNDLTAPTLEDCDNIMTVAKSMCLRGQVPMVGVLYCGEREGEEQFSCYAVYPQECGIHLRDDRITAVAWAAAGMPADAPANAADELSDYQILDTNEKLLDVFGLSAEDFYNVRMDIKETEGEVV